MGNNAQTSTTPSGKKNSKAQTSGKKSKSKSSVTGTDIPKGPTSAAAEPTALLTMKELCAHVKLAESTVFSLIASGQGPKTVHFGRARRFRQADVDEWVSSRIR